MKPNNPGGRETEKVFVLSGNNSNKNHKSSFCGKMGHLEAKCFTTMTCDKSHKKGHPAFLCPAQAQVARSPRRHGVKGTNKVKIADTFNDKYPKKKQSKFLLVVYNVYILIVWWKFV